MTLYAAHVLPQTGEHLSLYADKYSKLRLSAFQQSPAAFAGSIADELAMTPQRRLARILELDRKIIVVTAQSGEQDWLQEEWVGSLNLLGPQDEQEHSAPFNLHPRKQDTPGYSYTFDDEDGTADMIAKREVKAFYHMTALFVDMNHRRRGIAKLLCEKAYQVAIEQSGLADIRIFLHPTNVVALEIYKHFGFKTAHQKCTIAEACVAHHDPVPAAFDTDSKYNTRLGVIMVRHLG